MTFKDVAVDITQEDWELMRPVQKELYKTVTLQNYWNMVSLGLTVYRPTVIPLLEEPWMVIKEILEGPSPEWETEAQDCNPVKNVSKLTTGGTQTIKLEEPYDCDDKLDRQSTNTFREIPTDERDFSLRYFSVRPYECNLGKLPSSRDFTLERNPGIIEKKSCLQAFSSSQL